MLAFWLVNTNGIRVQAMSNSGDYAPIGINGMAHVILTVSRLDLAREFYGKLLPQLGMKPVFDGDKFSYWVGARTAIGIEPCDPASRVNGSSSNEWGCTTCACVLVRGKTWIAAPPCSRTSVRRSFVVLWKDLGHPATTMFCSRTQMASGWK